MWEWMDGKAEQIESNGNGGTYRMELRKGLNFGGPLVKLRWRYVKVEYRGLVGFYERTVVEGNNYSEAYRIHKEGEYKVTYSTLFAYTHQLMLGFNFATSKRAR